MLFLVFSIARKRYALPAEQIIEVLPNLTPDKLDSVSDPTAPDYFAGIIDYRGDQLPIIDLCQLLEDTPCPNLLSSRIILIKSPCDNSKLETIGLLAEKVTETIAVHNSEEAPPESPQFKKLIESQLSESNKVTTLFDLLNTLSNPLKQLLNHL